MVQTDMMNAFFNILYSILQKRKGTQKFNVVSSQFCLQYLVVLVFGLVMHTSTSAQTAHFSQFYANPLALNPALTGAIPEDIRISTIYRNQWTGINSPFETLALGVDASLKPKFLKNNALGVGIFLMNDELVEDIVHEQWMGVSLAWHHALDVHRRHMIALGVQAAMRRTSIDYQNLIFASQYEDFVYNPDLPSGETLLQQNLSNQLFNMGISWDFRVNDQLRLRSGFSVYDLLKNKESIFEDANITAFRRFGWNGGASIKINDRFSVHPEVLYLNQSKAKDINAGGYIGYKVGSQRNVVLYTGPWFRWKDAMIWMGGIGYKNMTIRASYDMTVSRLTQVKETEEASGNMVGAYELSMVWKLRLSRATKTEYTVPCGIF